MSRHKAGTRATANARTDRAKKSAFLDELVELTGRHRDDARAALRDAGKLKLAKQRLPREPIYRLAITAALTGQLEALAQTEGAPTTTPVNHTWNYTINRRY